MTRAGQDGVAVHLGSAMPESQRVDIRYRYIAWRNFFDYLDRAHGRAAVISFIHAMNRDASTEERSFAGAFSTSLAVEAAAFERAVLDGRYEARGTGDVTRRVPR